MNENDVDPLDDVVKCVSGENDTFLDFDNDLGFDFKSLIFKDLRDGDCIADGLLVLRNDNLDNVCYSIITNLYTLFSISNFSHQFLDLHL